MARYFHADTGDEIDVPDNEGLSRVLTKQGWEPAPDPEPIPGHYPDPVKYAPVTETLGKPPKGGPGSGRDEWAVYAATQGLDVTDDMTREEIIEAVEETTS